MPIVRSSVRPQTNNFLKQGAVESNKTVSDSEIKRLFRDFSDYKLSIRDKFLFTEGSPNIDIFLSNTGLSCSYTSQTDKLLKSNCYKERLLGNQ